MQVRLGSLDAAGLHASLDVVDSRDTAHVPPEEIPSIFCENLFTVLNTRARLGPMCLEGVYNSPRASRPLTLQTPANRGTQTSRFALERGATETSDSASSRTKSDRTRNGDGLGKMHAAASQGKELPDR